MRTRFLAWTSARFEIALAAGHVRRSMLWSALAMLGLGKYPPAWWLMFKLR